MMSIPSLMRCVPTPDIAGADHLEIQQQNVPVCGPSQVLIKVAAAGINRPDILQRDGLYPAPKGHSLILGLEVAGEIVQVGDDVKELAIGQLVCALVNGGGYGEYCVAEGGCVLPVPTGLNLVEAASLPETVFTVWHNVFERARLKSGDWFLVHGGSSGIGITAIQMAKAFGAKVIATAGSVEKCDACKRLGADEAINYKQQDFVQETKTITQGRGVNVILDMVGGDYIEKNFVAAGVEGVIVQIAFLGGAKANVNFIRLMMKRLTLTGSTLRARDEPTKTGIAQNVLEHIWPLVEAGTIKPQIDRVFKFDEIKKAHQHMEQGNHIGKIILDFC